MSGKAMMQEKNIDLKRFLQAHLRESLVWSLVYLAGLGICLFWLFGKYETLFAREGFERLGACVILLLAFWSGEPQKHWHRALSIPRDLSSLKIEYIEFLPVGGAEAFEFTKGLSALHIHRYWGSSLQNQIKTRFSPTFYVDTHLIDEEDFSEKVCAQREGEMPKYGFYYTKYSRHIVAIVPLGGRQRCWVLPEY
ncbi:MAG: hypothetical protein IJO31_04695, partial [Oscillospiraceae bacterium]|nr:hypothetical protein [Oscillospiraceae bacterium]